ncbi:EAL domain-containing protein [Devosia sp. BK]|uniref:EAL domain-containing protein n=1 Tax=Devosia sp. BK TaxID=2871706 RepID=UPI00293A4D04|nr:EAL domain-containing protein [Devosia sp. BK]MDV3251875.1 EAL domain-containing protein [Devosia sp. BK]
MTGGETEQLLRLQTEVLEAVAQGETLPAIARMLCLRAEQLAPGVICSILLVEDGVVLRPLAAPTLPQVYTDQIDGLKAGPKAGSCGTAVYHKTEVVVSDIAIDPLWDSFRAHAEPHGLRACWSNPIINHAGRVVATFAFYYREPRGPSDLERDIVATCVHLCALAIEHERIRERNFRLAYFDVLTGLANRGRFNQLLSDVIDDEQPFGLILLDIDHLKSVNDTIGHAAGDRLIATVAARLNSVNDKLVPCRLGGDEFAVIVRGCDSHELLEHWGSLLCDAATGMVEMGGQTFEAHVTMGGALFGVDGITASTLIQNADFALYHAKQARRGGYMAFHSDLRTQMTHRHAMVREVDQALLENRIEPHYQPIVNITTNQIVGLEALARLRMPDGAVVSAGQFHTALSDPRIAYEMTGQMLTQVARDMRHWLDVGLNFQHVGVNVTTGDFLRGDLADRIIDIFGRASVPLSHIVLEVNEAVFMGGSDKIVPNAVEALRARGILVALDDFGTGFASLTHLLSFPVDIIKIDRSFVTRLGVDGPSEALVSGIVDIAHKLDMRTVAEGVEREEQAEMLRRLGCNLAQGYLYARPVPARVCTGMLEAYGQTPGDNRKTA